MSETLAPVSGQWSAGVLRPVPMRGLDSWSVTATDDGSAGFVLRAETTVPADEPALRGHFPGLTIYPGVFVLETVLQALSLAVETTLRLHTLRSVRFLAPLLAGDTFVTSANVTTSTPGEWRTRGTVERSSSTAARFDLRFRGITS